MRLGLYAVVLGAVLASWLPRAAGAANVCNASLDFTYPTGPNFAVPGSSDPTLTTYTVKLALGAGSITGVVNPILTIHRVRFDLDCVGNPALTCTDQGPIVEYGGDSTITSDCPVAWSTNVPGGGSATNEILFAPSPVLTKTPNSPPCSLSFTIKVLSEEPMSPDVLSDSSPFTIEEGAGYIQAAGDASCNNALSAGNQVTGSIFVCPVCTDTDCSTSACSQDTGQCVLTPKPDSGACTTDNAGNPVLPIPGACKTPGCEAGDCVRAHIDVTDSTTCSADNLGNPVTAIPGACKTPGCEAGVCVVQHVPIPDSTACTIDNAGNPVLPIPGACKTPGCEAGQCVQAHINVTDSTVCSADNLGNPVVPIPGACKTPGCEGGACVVQHVPVTDSTACAVDNAGNPVSAIPGSCKTPGCEAGQCVRSHINVTDSTVCSADNLGNPVAAIPGACKTPGCEGGECVRAHINVTDSTACSADNAGNPVNPVPGACKTPGCEAGTCVTQHVPVTDSTPCSVDNAGNPVTALQGACKTPGCEGGQCVRAHVTVTDSTVCSVDDAGNPVNAVPGACKTPGCEAGVCVAQHVPVTDSTACSVDNAGNPVTAIPGACKTPGCEAGQCVRAHINVTDSTVCSADNAGNPVNALPGACKTPGCEAGVCAVQHVNKTDSTPCSVDANGNPVTPNPGCQLGCEAGACAPSHVCVTTTTTTIPPCIPSPEKGHCNDMVDNDCNGLIDCLDPACKPSICEGGGLDGQSCATVKTAQACASAGGVCPCPPIQKDPTRIVFGPPGAGLDYLYSHGRVVVPGPPLDVVGSGVGWLISNNQGRIFSAVVPPGALWSNHRGTLFKYTNRSARTEGGVYRVRIHISGYRKSYGYYVEAYGDISGATDPNMAIQFYIGNQPTPGIHAEKWERTPYGWKAHGFAQ